MILNVDGFCHAQAVVEVQDLLNLPKSFNGNSCNAIH